jgi:hypothetical protein
VGHPDDPKRAGDLLPGHLSRHALAVPARRHLGERAGDLVGQVEAPGEQPSALAEVRRRQLELLLASDQLLGDEAGALRQRPVVREMPDEVPHVLGRFGGRAEDLHAALEVDLVAADPAREVGRGRGATDVGEKSNVVDV